jgi:hypothetical protein
MGSGAACYRSISEGSQKSSVALPISETGKLAASKCAAVRMTGMPGEDERWMIVLRCRLSHAERLSSDDIHPTTQGCAVMTLFRRIGDHQGSEIAINVCSVLQAADHHAIAVLRRQAPPLLPTPAYSVRSNAKQAAPWAYG